MKRVERGKRACLAIIIEREKSVLCENLPDAPLPMKYWAGQKQACACVARVMDARTARSASREEIHGQRGESRHARALLGWWMRARRAQPRARKYMGSGAKAGMRVRCSGGGCEHGAPQTFIIIRHFRRFGKSSHDFTDGLYEKNAPGRILRSCRRIRRCGTHKSGRGAYC